MIAPKLQDGDLIIENGEWIFVEGNEELAQSVESVLRTRKSEFFLEKDHGLIRDNLLGKVANQDEARDDIIEAISQEPRIKAVTDVTFADDRKTRKREISVTLEKEDGTQLVIEGVPLDA